MKACLNCQDRYVGCHDHCNKPDRLLEVARNQQVREARARESELSSFTIDAVRHSVKQGGRASKNA